MTQFSPSDAALEGFRLTREHPLIVLGWSAVYLVGILLIGVIMAAALGPAFVELARKGPLTDAADLQAVADLLAKSWPTFLMVMVAAAFLMSVITAGVMRLVLRPTEPGPLHLRLGATELRLTAANLICVGIYAASAVLAIVFTAGATTVGEIGAFLALVLVLAFGLWLGVRLSLLTPTVFVTNRVSVGEAWRNTQGRFWPLFGMIVMAVVFYVIIWILFSMIAFAVVELAGGQGAMRDPGRLGAVGVVALFVTLLLQFVLQVLQIVMIYAPFAVAYRDLVGAAPDAG
ncbi:hypothetical protein [Phenylobacterium sp.]|jgi:hypothetical protein|uniref:hypothetical protein n=1 Tax=Phenylobacterium sp. TaxID=1871053 RepID=UPI0037C87B45